MEELFDSPVKHHNFESADLNKDADEADEAVLCEAAGLQRFAGAHAVAHVRRHELVAQLHLDNGKSWNRCRWIES